jgi:hypothetical protein
MKIIDNEKIKEWLSEKKLLDSQGSLSILDFSKLASYRIPIDSGKKTVLSRVITSFFDFKDASLLWINEYGIWPSNEDWTLFNGFRKSIGEKSQLFEKPGHIFTEIDIDTINSLVAMILYFNWGAMIVSAKKDILIKISHDEILEVFTHSKINIEKEILNKIELIKKLGVTD